MAWATPPTRADGDIISGVIWNAELAANLQFLASGGAQQMLRMNDAATAPEWAGGISLIGSTLLGGTVATIDFTSISANYKSLYAHVYARGSGAVATTPLLIQMNGDTGANYDTIRLTGINATASVASTAAQTSASAFVIPGASATANYYGGGWIIIPNYSNTTQLKTILAIGGTMDATATTNWQVDVRVSTQRASTAARNRVTFLNAASFVTDTRISLYGTS